MKIVPNARGVSSVIGWTRTFNRDGAEVSSYRSSLTTFDTSGLRLEETEFEPNGRIEKKKVFDSRDRVSEEVIYNTDGTINLKRVYQYDEAGNEMEVSMYLGGDRYHGKWLSKTDSYNQVIERVWLNSDGKEEVVEHLEYNSRGLIQKRVRGNVAEWSYQYNDAGQLIRCVGGYFSSVEPDDVDIEYDQEGRVAKKTRYFSTGSSARQPKKSRGGALTEPDGA